MATTVNVLCYKSKTLGNGEHPLMVCVCMDGKRKYKSLGVSVRAEHWNFEKNVPKSNCPNREHINILIANKKKEYETEIAKLKSEDKLFIANSLSDQISNSVKPKTVEEAFKEYIQLLQDENRRGYMLSIKQVYNSLIKYNKHLNIHFTDMDVAWLKKYETWLRNNGLAENTIGIRFRTLRTIYNYATSHESEIIKSHLYNFKTGEQIFIDLSDTLDEALTNRELEVLQLMKKGVLSKEIAETLKVSINTVNSHRQNILQKLKANNSIEAVNFAQRLGLFNKYNIDKSEKRDVLP